MLASILLLPAVLLILGMPIFLVLLGAATVAVVFFVNVPPTVIAQTALNSLTNYNLLAVPFFIYAGALMSACGMASKLVNVAIALLGGVRGGLPITNVGAATLYGSVTGATAATVAALAPIFYPEMLKRGYHQSFAAGLVTSAGFLGSVIPPSIMMILYATSAEESALKLFTAGIVPGVFIAVLMALYCYVHSLRHNLADRERFSGRRLWLALKEGKWAFGAPLVIFGGLYSGIFSPTESGGIACVYAIVVSVLIERNFTWKRTWEVAVTAMALTTQVFIIVAAAGVFSWLLTTNGVARASADFIISTGLGPVAVLLLINVLLLFVGCVVDTSSAILVLTPLLLPIVTRLGVDPIHFGIVMTVNLSIGSFTPPFGVNIFVTQSVLAVPLLSIYRGLVPFFCVTVVGLAVVTLVPEMSLWLVDLLN